MAETPVKPTLIEVSQYVQNEVRDGKLASLWEDVDHLSEDELTEIATNEADYVTHAAYQMIEGADQLMYLQEEGQEKVETTTGEFCKRYEAELEAAHKKYHLNKNDEPPHARLAYLNKQAHFMAKTLYAGVGPRKPIRQEIPVRLTQALAEDAIKLPGFEGFNITARQKSSLRELEKKYITAAAVQAIYKDEKSLHDKRDLRSIMEGSYLGSGIPRNGHAVTQRFRQLDAIADNFTASIYRGIGKV